MDLFKLVGTIAIKNADANAALKETQEEAKDTAKDVEKSSSGIGESFKKIGAAVATYLTVDAVIAFGKGCIEAAADANAASSQFSQVFGELEDNAGKSLSGIADKAGISENRMKGSFTKIAAFAKTTGMDTEDALSLSERAMIAVADSAAFYDRTLEDTTESLQSFLKGNYENDSALGLSCTETTRNAAANALYGKSFKDLSEAQKQLTLLQMVEDANATSGALGQAARESDTWTNQTGNLKQAWTDFQAVLGSNVLPAAVGIVQTMVDWVETWTVKLPELINWCKEHETTMQTIAIVLGTVATAITAYNIAQNTAAIVTAITTAATTAFGSVLAFITSPITLVVLAIGALIAIGVALYQNWDVVKEKATELWTNVTEAFENMRQSVTEKVESIKAGAIEKFQAMKDTMGALMQGARDVVNAKLQSMKDAYNSHGGGIKGIVAAMLTNIKGNYTAVFTAIDQLTGGKLSNIANAFRDKLESAKNFVGNAIDKIKNFFDFDWSLPHISLPHFSISGSFSLNPPEVPDFSIDWYKKAYDTPVLLDSPAIFGYNASTGKFLGGGDGNGAEVVSGANTLMGMIQNAVSGNNAAMLAVLYKILEAILALDENMGGNLREALAGTSFEINNREFARLVKAVN